MLGLFVFLLALISRNCWTKVVLDKHILFILVVF